MRRARPSLSRWGSLLGALALGFTIGIYWASNFSPSPLTPCALPVASSAAFAARLAAPLPPPSPTHAPGTGGDAPPAAAAASSSSSSSSAAPASGGTLLARCEAPSAYVQSRVEASGRAECREWLRGGRDFAPEFTSRYNQDTYFFYNFFRCMPGPGTYLDVGASHPKLLSNTYFLDVCLGWRGVCVEPDPALAAGFRAGSNRSCLVVDKALSSAPGKGVLRAGLLQRLEEGAGGGEGEVVPLVTVEDVLAEAAWLPGDSGRVVVDFMSLAVEEHELEVLLGVPWDAAEVRFITVTNTKATLDVREFLQDQAYAMVLNVGMEDFYARLPVGRELWLPPMLNWNRHAHAGIRKKFHAVNSYLKESLYKGWGYLLDGVSSEGVIPKG
jgi:hypothetical protein